MRVLATFAIAATIIVTQAQADTQRTLPVRISDQIVSTWRCQDQLGVDRTPARWSPWKTHSESFRHRELSTWKARRKSCVDALRERARQWNWQAFPSWIIQLGVCESGGSGGAPSGVPNWYAEGSSSDGTFYSAFNIGRSRYDEVAHRMGVRGWNEGAGVPSPWEQAMAVIGYVRTYGDGFTGSCHGIARSSW